MLFFCQKPDPGKRGCRGLFLQFIILDFVTVPTVCFFSFFFLISDLFLILWLDSIPPIISLRCLNKLFLELWEKQSVFLVLTHKITCSYIPPVLPDVGLIPVISAVYSNCRDPEAWPLPSTSIIILYCPIGPLPTLHVTLVVVAPVTVHSTPPIVTVFSDATELKPEPVITRTVPNACVPS